MTLTNNNFENLSFRERCALHVRMQRKARKVSQEQLSESIGFHRTYVSTFERGIQNMSLDAVESLRRALELKPKDSAQPSLRQIFAQNLRSVRVGKAISQEALGFAAGLHRTYVSQAERCVTNISLDNVDRLAIALGVMAETLVGFDTQADVAAARVFAANESKKRG